MTYRRRASIATRSCMVARVLAITTYQWILSFHIFAAVVWVGGAIASRLYAWFAIRSPLPGRKAEFTNEVGLIGQRVFAPTSVILLLLGFWLMHEGAWEYGDAWVIIALLGWASTFVTGVFVLTPMAKRLHQTIERTGPDSAETSAAIDGILRVSRIDLVVLIVVVFDMALKPGL